jgi:uncharacterized protein YcaQ
VRARGLITEGRVADYYRVPGRSRTLTQAIDGLVAEGVLQRVRVGERVALVDPARLAQQRARSSAAVLLSPFDNLIWDREETDRLFGFRHSLEIYTPRAKRRWGYYVMPLVVGDRIIGRADVRADRAASEVRILSMHWEGRPAWRALARAQARLAWTLSLTPAPIS